MLDVPYLWHTKPDMSQAPIIVDLSKLKIAEMTNLPPKAKKGDEDKAASSIKRKIEEKYTKEEPKENPKVEEKKEEPKKEEPTPVKDEEAKPIKQDFLVAPQPSKPKAPVKKVEPKPQPPKPEPKKDTPKKNETKKEEPQLANPLKSLLASVDALEKEEGPTSQVATIKDVEGVQNMGIEGGSSGSYFSELSISEIDAIAGRLRACWNLDPGAQGIKDMIIEIRAYLNQDGSVRDVKILDAGRYSSDKAFRSVADSARRAVYVCAPYTIFAKQYPEKYDMWKTMMLRFNPLDGNIK